MEENAAYQQGLLDVVQGRESLACVLAAAESDLLSPYVDGELAGLCLLDESYYDQ